MNIWTISDLHLEFGEPFSFEPPADADVVVCAGDILTKGIVPSLRWLAKYLAGKIPIVVVAGNHEFYGDAVQESLKEAVAESHAGVHFLENSVVEIDGVSFIGGTLWTDFRLFGINPQVAMSYAAHDMNDYTKIRLSKNPYSKFRPIDTYKKHVETREFIATELRKRSTEKAVVVTHHAPSPRSVASEFRHDPLSACYASDLQELILETPPALWVHGHVHHRNDYYVGSTRIVSNPRGYPKEQTQFAPGLIVEV
ncbi:metallophosphoesterase [Rhizobium indigoferae]|uniref:Metallophosphoesterase n=1 Tax=Rhizobium indigoferae TaxID=158891 RepID=A0ABZ0ZE82_9HYPH|nr:metallophosphoesterase [Rhizobium indigoferae]NNU56125.1 phosphatase [Rhizobium indigoferae]WQN37754.1 metallophosphoesterase [Rhizobium indigoferae]GLR59353.1 phosphatase [Rhizobium indigoferae]